MPRGISGLVAAAQDSELDEKHFLGRLGVYSHPDDNVPASRATRTWAKHGLDPDLLPKVRTATHVFQSACRSVEKRSNGGTGVEIAVDKAFEDDNEIVYQVTRLVRDKKQKIIEHPKAMTIALDKHLETIDVRQLEDYDALRGLEEAIRKDFAKNAKTVSGQKIRNAVRETLERMGAQRLFKKSSLHYIPTKYRDPDGAEQLSGPVIDALRAAIQELWGEERARFYAWPLMNAEGEREMLRHHFKMNAREKARELMEEAVQRVRSGTSNRGVRQDFTARMWNERRKLLAAVADFEKLVDLERDDIETDLKDLDKALGDLQDMADNFNGGS